jgi:polysaccharide export outer membrane protein
MKKMKLILDRIVSVVSLLVLVSLLASGCATAPEPEFFTSAPPVLGPTNSPNASGNVFQIGDMVLVTFSGVETPPPPHTERIKEDGDITLPLIGAVKAVGKTSGELQKEIHGLYVPKYYVRLTVTVIQSTEQLFYVTGEVRIPGPKQYSATGVTVTQAISAAGGPTEFARRSRVQLTRSNGAKEQINYDKALRDPKLDLKVFPGDSIHIPRRLF